MTWRTNCKTRFIFITGGVTSSLGKGLANASLGLLLLSMNKNLKIRFVKCDPYLNIDPGTMNPNQHGEVYVLDDGCETDLDFGHYARFTNLHMTKSCSITAGKIYASLLDKERAGGFLGQTVQIIPHLTNEIKEFIYKNIVYDDGEEADFILCEIGGTVGDMEALPFLEAIRQIGYELKENVMYLHMTLIPYLKAAKELKTKPTQHSTSILRSIGIQPDVLLCRSEYDLSIELRSKIGNFCNVLVDNVVPLLDVDNIYKIPLMMQKNKLDQIICNHFKLDLPNPNYLNYWTDIIDRNRASFPVVRVGVVGKYGEFDSYKSLFEALNHSGIKNNAIVISELIDAKNVNDDNTAELLKGFDGIIVPGGFGTSGIDGKIAVISHARKNNIPIFGICYGMQLALVEIARNVLSLEDANSTELNKNCKNPIVCMMSEWKKDDGKTEYRTENNNLGGTMRLGAYDCRLVEGSIVKKIYNNEEIISERHRHRYEFNNKYREIFKDAGVLFSGLSIDSSLVEIMEMPNHRWFIAVQFHPELKSCITNSHPLFNSFIAELLKGK